MPVYAASAEVMLYTPRIGSRMVFASAKVQARNRTIHSYLTPYVGFGVASCLRKLKEPCGLRRGFALTRTHRGARETPTALREQWLSETAKLHALHILTHSSLRQLLL